MLYFYNMNTIMVKKENPTKKLFELFKGKPVTVRRTDVGTIKGTLTSYDPNTKLLHTDNGKVSVERIKWVETTAKMKPKKPENPFEEHFIERGIYTYFIGEEMRKFKFLGDYTYFLLVQDKKLFKAINKIRLVGIAVIRPYPEELFSGEVEAVSYPPPGRWREEYQELVSIINEEMGEDTVHEIELLLRDGRTLRGYTSRFFTKGFLTMRLFAQKDLKGPSLQLYTHSVEDIISIEDTGEEAELKPKKLTSESGGENKEGGEENALDD